MPLEEADDALHAVDPAVGPGGRHHHVVLLGVEHELDVVAALAERDEELPVVVDRADPVGLRFCLGRVGAVLLPRGP